METQVATATSARGTEIQNKTYCGDVSVVGWKKVSIVPHNKKNPESSEDGVWVVVGFRKDQKKHRILAEGTKKYCEDYVHDSKVAYAYEGENCKELWDQIYKLLIEAGTIALLLNQPHELSELSWTEQQNLINKVHETTRKAKAIARLYDGGSMHNEVVKVNRDCEVARLHAIMTVFGRSVWNVKVYITEAQAEKIDWATVFLVKIEGEQRDKLPNHFTYQLVLSPGKVLAQGTKRGCEAFMYACQIHFQEIAQIAVQQREAEERAVAAERQIVTELEEVEKRLMAGEKFVGEIQQKTQEAFETANRIGIDVTAFADKIMNVAIGLRVGQSA